MEGFETIETSGDARIGILKPNNLELETPHLFPVINFYGGGNEGALFGGGIHRTIKEFMVNHPEVVNNDYSDLFGGVMTSISSLTDFNISEKKLDNYYMSKKIKDWDNFSDFKGALFVDSGGFKIMTQGGLEGANFEKQIDQKKAYEYQRKIGGDILVNLDHPILPDDSYKERVEKTQKTIANAKEFIEISEDFNGSKFLTVHGYNKSMIRRFMDTAIEEFDQPLEEIFDGIALGSLVPKKDDYETLINAVRGCKEIMEDEGLEDKPLHVLGISSRAIPLLVLLGADTFDSATYLQNAINGSYMTSLTDSISIDEAREENFSRCSCRVCNDKKLRDQMKGNTEYKKDIYGVVAIHNIEVQKREIDLLKQKIREGEDPLKSHIEDTLGNKDNIKKFAYRVINSSLEEYF